MAFGENGVAVASNRRVSESWVRKTGTPFSSSLVVTDAQLRLASLSRVLAMIASRWVVMNSCSIALFPSDARQPVVDANDPSRLLRRHVALLRRHVATRAGSESRIIRLEERSTPSPPAPQRMSG